MKIKLTETQKRDVWRAFNDMLHDVDFGQVATAINILCPQQSSYVTPEKLKDDVLNGKDYALTHWVKDKDGHYEVDLDECIIGSDEYGYMIHLILDSNTEICHWNFSLNIANQYVSSLEDNEDDDPFEGDDLDPEIEEKIDRHIIGNEW